MPLTYLFWCSDTAAPHKTYVAVKILNAHATGCIVGGLSAEYDVFRRIESANPRHPGFAHCLTIHHCFTLYSSVGGHICFATDVLGPNMMTLRSAQPNQTFPVSVVKRIIKQILLSVDYLHRECGYVHTGNSLYLIHWPGRPRNYFRHQIRQCLSSPVWPDCAANRQVHWRSSNGHVRQP